MTQRVARPMKFAAFISIIISVAVMFAACQGAVGTPGDTGPQGPKGDPGDTGDPGQSGTSALTPLPDPPAIMINDGKEDGQTSVGSVPAGLSASSYFRGGKLPLKFAAERVDQDEDGTNDEGADTEIAKTFDLKVDASTGAITITKRSSPVAPKSPAEAGDPVYNLGDHFKLTVTDADGFPSDTLVKVLRNRAPTKTANGDIATAATTAIVVGNQDGIELDTDNKEQTSTDRVRRNRQG